MGNVYVTLVTACSNWADAMLNLQETNATSAIDQGDILSNNYDVENDTLGKVLNGTWVGSDGEQDYEGIADPGISEDGNSSTNDINETQIAYNYANSQFSNFQTNMNSVVQTSTTTSSQEGQYQSQAMDIAKVMNSMGSFIAGLLASG